MTPAPLLLALVLLSPLLFSVASSSGESHHHHSSHHGSHHNHDGSSSGGHADVRASVYESRAASSAASSCSGGSHGSAGVFDFYVLAFSSSPEYCQSSSTYGKYPGCQNPTAWQAVNLTMHGLWPQYTAAQSGFYGPQCCSTQALTQATITPLLPQLERQWPNEQDPTGSSLGVASTLWAHEWTEHGTCSGLTQSSFFTTALHTALTVPTPSVITSHIGGTATRDAIESAFNNGAPCGTGACLVFLECSGGTLEGVNVCFSKTLTRMECPTAVTGASSRCKAGNVKIAGFKASAASSHSSHSSQAQEELRR